MNSKKLEYFNFTAASLLLQTVGARDLKITGSTWRRLEFKMADGQTHSIELGPQDGVPLPLIEAFVVSNMTFDQQPN
jgi:hypothetical protein